MDCMKVKIDPKKELFKWGPIPFKHFYATFWFDAIWLRLWKEYKWIWPECLGIYRNGNGTFVLNDEDLRHVGAQFFKAYFLNRRRFTQHWKRWEKWILEWDKRKTSYNEHDLQNLSNNTLRNRLHDFYEFNALFWVIVHVPEVANWGGERMLRQELSNIDSNRIDEYLEILAAPVRY